MYNDETKELVSDMMSIAKNNLEKYGNVTPIAFICRNNKILAPCMISFGSRDEKVAMYEAVGGAARKLVADSVILINECTMKMVSLDKQEIKKMDAIIILHVNFVSKKSLVTGQAFLKNENNVIDYIDIPGFNSTAESAFGDIQGSVISGYDSCSMKMKDGENPIEFIDGSKLFNKDEESC